MELSMVVLALLSLSIQVHSLLSPFIHTSSDIYSIRSLQRELALSKSDTTAHTTTANRR